MCELIPISFIVAQSWAARGMQTYAPELAKSIVGFSMGGVPVDLFASAISVNGGIAAGLIVGLFQGLVRH